MKYNPLDPRDIMEAHRQLDYFISAKIPFELDKIKVSRTSRQNSYYWLVLKYYASQIGFTKVDAEKEFKEVANPDIFVREYTDKLGHTHTVIRSSADLTKEEMTSALNNFRVYAETYAGISIPYEDDYADIKACQREIKLVEGYI